MIEIIGHRGAAGYAPENTLLSFQTAIDLGCDVAELDVRMSQDGIAVVIHDETVSRVTDGMGFVSHKTLLELQALHCAEGQKIPTLLEVIRICKGKIRLQIELKEKGTPRSVEKIVSDNQMENDVSITSFDLTLLQEITSLNSLLSVGLLFHTYSEEVWECAETVPLTFIGLRYTSLTKEIVATAHKKNLLVYAYHVKSKESGNEMLSLGVDKIGTAFPKLFIK